MPHVTDPRIRIVFCEGRPGSLDDLLLGNILPLGRVWIQPVGGKYGMKAFIEGYLGSYSGPAPDYVGFRDRDFDVEPPDAPALVPLRGHKPIWLCYRTAVESYLIEASLLHRYWSERQDTPGWQHGPALSQDEIQNHIQLSARELTDYQAVRWALSKLKPGQRWPEICTSWTDHGSGDIPSSLDYDDCLVEACQLVASFQEQVQPAHIDALKEHAQAYRERFNAPDFFQEHKYLIWFHGKDHLVQLCRRLAPQFPRNPYSEWAAQNVDVRKHPDLQQLVACARGTA